MTRDEYMRKWRSEHRTDIIRTEMKHLYDLEHDPNHPDHGQPKGYRYGCRCPRCKKAYSIYSREIRRRHSEEMLADPDHPAHGTRKGYNWGCRCPRCSEASSAYTKNRRKEKGSSNDNT